MYKPYRQNKFFSEAYTIKDMLEIIKNKVTINFTLDEEDLYVIVDSLIKIQNTDKEQEFIKFIHYLESKIAITSTQYFIPNFNKNLLAVGGAAIAYANSYEKYKTYTPWQQVLLAKSSGSNPEGIDYEKYSNEEMDNIVESNPLQDEKEYREKIFNQIYRANVCREAQIRFLLPEQDAIDEIYDIIGKPPKKRKEITEEEKNKIIDILLDRGPEERPEELAIRKFIADRDVRKFNRR